MTWLSESDQVGIEATVFDFLGTLVNIERPQYTDDGMGARTWEWLTVAANVNCKFVQRPLGLRLDDNWLRPSATTTVTFPKATDVRLGDHLRQPDDSIWLVQTVPVPKELTLTAEVMLV
jgi:hypothetical protein